MEHFLLNTIELARFYQSLGNSTFSQLSDEDLFWQYNAESNSVAIIVNHLAGNMLSRWTNFLHEDGEKTWRDRDAEFENQIHNRDQLISRWNEGWSCFLGSLESLTESDLNKIVYIRNEGHTVVDAIQRQMAHYPYHIGQIVMIGKMRARDWRALTIPKGQSQSYNKDKFSKEKTDKHFTQSFNEAPQANKSWHILKATSSDFEELLHFAKQNFIDTYAHQNDPKDFQLYLEQAFARSSFQEEFNNPESYFYLCKMDEELVGYYKLNIGEAQTEIGHPEAAEIERIYVSKPYKGQGLGKAMVRHASGLARDLNLKYLWLGVWEENPEAIAFYKRMGFEPIDTHLFQLGSDAQTDVIMRLTF